MSNRTKFHHLFGTACISQNPVGSVPLTDDDAPQPNWVSTSHFFFFTTDDVPYDALVVRVVLFFIFFYLHLSERKKTRVQEDPGTNNVRQLAAG